MEAEFEMDGIDSVQNLHRDLIALSEARLAAVERLWIELEARIAEFKTFLEKPRRNEKSLEALRSGSIEIDGEKYSLNDKFKEECLTLSDNLDLDQIQSAKLIIAAQRESQILESASPEFCVQRYHKKRQLLLESLRLAIEFSLDPEIQEEHGDVFREFVRQVLDVKDGQVDKGFAFLKRCIAAMADVEKWQQQIVDRSQVGVATGQANNTDASELNKLQHESLTLQHESLSAICIALVKAGYADTESFRSVVNVAKKLDKYDIVLVHYVPLLMSLISQFGSSESSCSMDDAASLNTYLLGPEESEWGLRSFHAAVSVWWLAEYSGRFIDIAYLIQSGTTQKRLEEEAKERESKFSEALKQGALHFTLSMSQDLCQNKSWDPSRLGVISFFLQGFALLSPESLQPSESFRELSMERFQFFVEAFICNMHDSLRRLKAEEDDQRRTLVPRIQREPVQHDLHLERFLVVVSCAYDGYSDAASNFWSEAEGNLYGFLQWAAKRLTTPRVAAFCDMLRSISYGEEHAEAAHRFLVEESSSSAGKLRRAASLSYSHIFDELQFYASALKEKAAPAQSSTYGTAHNPVDQIVEDESAMMLECYLRLFAHICGQSMAAREWVLKHPLNVPLTLLSLCSVAVESRLRATAFTAISSLLVDKTLALNDHMWKEIDSWIHTAPIAIPKPTAISGPTSRHQGLIWNTLASGFEESNAFVGLLGALVEPSIENSLNDTLPFPESIGSAHRMPGIEVYVDFVIEKVFLAKLDKPPESQDAFMKSITRWNCLKFINTCLQSFNEDLVVLANTTNAPVDAAIGASSLSTYVQLHPFARVMEWLFNQSVLAELFKTSHQDIRKVEEEPSDSPFVVSLVQAVEVMNSLLRLQPTYLDIVRPIINTQNSNNREPISTPIIASFEDAILSDMTIIADLGYYCDAQHQDLAMASLRLLSQLSTARKLISPLNGFGQRSDRSRIIGVLEKNKCSDRVASYFKSAVSLDQRDLEAGPDSARYIIMIRVLDLLDSALSALPNKPTLSHLLLGFPLDSKGSAIIVNEPLPEGASLFDAVLRLAVNFPEQEGPSYWSWLLTAKSICWAMLRKLWSSSLSASHTMSLLRSNDLLLAQFLRMPTIDGTTLWDGLTALDDDFMFSASAKAFGSFLAMRSAVCDYAARELRSVSEAKMATLHKKVVSTMLGKSSLPSGEIEANIGLFELFDFMELDFRTDYSFPSSKWFSDLSDNEFRIDPRSPYDMRISNELLLLKMSVLRKESRFQSALDEEQAEADKALILAFLEGSNQIREVLALRTQCLESWTSVIVCFLQNAALQDSEKFSFILRCTQLVLPKLERAFAHDYTTASLLINLSKSLIQLVNFETASLEKTNVSGFGNDQLYQLFRASLSGLTCPVSSDVIRETCYQIAYRYLRGVLRGKSTNARLIQNVTKTIQGLGNGIISVICDDAYSGQGNCRISACYFLNAVVMSFQKEDLKYLLDRVSNFLNLVVEDMKNIPSELRSAKSSDVDLLLSYYDAGLSLVLKIAQTPQGAALIIDAGLFDSIRHSQIFAADPDIGLEFDDSDALRKYFELMLSMTRIINAVVISRGQLNDQVKLHARKFLKENRQTIVAIFKRYAKVGGLQVDSGTDLESLVDNFTLLISACGFIDYEEESHTKATPLNVFS